MNIRFFLPCLLLTIAAPVSSAEEAAARLFYNDKSHDDAFVYQYKNGVAHYKLQKRSINMAKVKAPKLVRIYFYEPKIFSEAMDLYHGRKYAAAKTKFAECAEAYKSVDTVPNNYATLAGFYNMECSRRMMDLEALSTELSRYIKTGLTRETHLQQLEVNAFWEAVRLKDWERLDLLAKAWSERKVSGTQRAQIAYCHGLALEHLSEKSPKLLTDSLNAYNVALTADFTASTEIVIAASSNALRLYFKDPKVQLAMKLWKTNDENAQSVGYQRLLEANALARLYTQSGCDKVKPLDSDLAKFLKYEQEKEKSQ